MFTVKNVRTFDKIKNIDFSKIDAVTLEKVGKYNFKTC